MRHDEILWPSALATPCIFGAILDILVKLGRGNCPVCWGWRSGITLVELGGVYTLGVQNFVFESAAPLVLAKAPQVLTSKDTGDGDVVSFARERLGFSADLRQEELLRCEAKQAILNCSRQWGKSTVAAIKAVHRAYSVPKSLVVVASPTDRQSAEFVEKARGFVVQLGLKARGDGHNKTSLRLPNGSRIVGLPGKEANIRGFSSVSLLIIDEAARVGDELYKTLRPMLTVADGDLWLLSTPYGKRGFFHENWEFGGDAWARFRVPATECSRISPTRLEFDRGQMGDAWFRQEYMCEFLATESQMFCSELVQDALRSDEEGWVV